MAKKAAKKAKKKVARHKARHDAAKTRQSVSIKLGKTSKPEAEIRQPEEIKSKVEKELLEFQKTHEKSGAAPAKIREQDEHVDFEHIKQEIVRKLSSAKGAAKEISATEKMEVIESGIEGLDKILGGGLPKNSFILLSGTCGTGKSIFGMNFLIEGALRGEPGIYISLEESPDSSIQQMKLLGWPVDELVKKKKLLILQPELYNFDALLTTIEDSVEKIKAKRLVIDSISIIGMYFADPYKVRKSLLGLGSLLKKVKCTTIAIDEIREGTPSLSSYGVEEFVADGVIVLYLIKRSNIYVRAILIRKMRGLDHSTKIHPMEIKLPKGMVIYPSQELFEESE